MVFVRKCMVILILLGGLSGCNIGSMLGSVTLAGYGMSAFEKKHGTFYKIGKPYFIHGRLYYPKEDYTYDKTGIASWYGPGVHAQYTANGGIFDMMALTAAHRTLPIPSIVRVTNLKNGLSLVVEITDRGPYAENRIIDLSYAAAKRLGIIHKGTALVRVQILPKQSKALKMAFMRKKQYHLATDRNIPYVPSLHFSDASKRLSGRYVQAGVYESKADALKVAGRIKDLGAVKIFRVNWRGYILNFVRIGPVKTQKRLRLLIKNLLDRGFNAVAISVGKG